MSPQHRQQLIDSYRAAERALAAQMEVDLLKYQESLALVRERLRDLTEGAEQ